MSIGKESLLLFSVMFLPGFVTQSGFVNSSGWDSVPFNMAILAVSVPQILLVVYVTELRTPGFGRSLGWRRPKPEDALSALIAGAALFAAVSAVSLLVSQFSRDPSIWQPTVEWSFSRLELLPLVVSSGLAIGYREEIFYRAYLISRGEEAGVHRIVLVAGPSLIFATGHLYQGWVGFLVSLVIGLVLALVFLWRRSLHGIALAHAIYNVSVLVLSGSG